MTVIPPARRAWAMDRMAPDVPEGFSPFARSSPFLDLVGPLYAKSDEHGLALGLRIAERHCNRRGFAHGGLLVTLADLVLGYSLGHGTDQRIGLVTTSLTTDFVGVVRVGDWVEARADFQRTGSNVAFANCYLTVGERRVARASGVFTVVRA